MLFCFVFCFLLHIVVLFRFYFCFWFVCVVLLGFFVCLWIVFFFFFFFFFCSCVLSFRYCFCFPFAFSFFFYYYLFGEGWVLRSGVRFVIVAIRYYIKSDQIYCNAYSHSFITTHILFCMHHLYIIIIYDPQVHYHLPLMAKFNNSYHIPSHILLIYRSY